MAIQSFESTHNLTEQQWNNDLYKEWVNNTYFRRFMGTGINSMVKMISDLGKGKGTKVTIPKLHLLDADSGVTGNEALEGKEQDLTYGAGFVEVDQVRNGVRIENGLSEQRTARDARNDSREVLGIWKTEEADNVMFDAAYAGGPTANRGLQCTNAKATSGATLGSDADAILTQDTLSVRAIRSAKALAQNGGGNDAERMKPFKEKDRHGLDCFVLFAHPYAILDLKSDPLYEKTSTALTELMGKEAPFIRGGVVNIDGVLIIECDKVRRRANASGVVVAENLFMGAGALAFATCKTTFWQEREFDYGQQSGFAIGDIKGAKRIKFNSCEDDNGLMVIYSSAVLDL